MKKLMDPGKWEHLKGDIPSPGRNEVVIKVEACGICHSDSLTLHAHYPGISFPRVPGHEVAGKIVKIGPDVLRFKEGMRVGVGWHGVHCGICDCCRHGSFVICPQLKVTGIHVNGGYTEYMVASATALALIPDGLSYVDAAPLMCAGVTTYNSLRNAGARAGDLVAVAGIGGLGHLGVQFSKKMGYRTVAIGKTADKRDLSISLGADIFLAASSQNVVEELQKLGGAKVIMATVPDAKSMTELLPGLGPDGVFLVLGAEPAPINVSPLLLISKRARIQGWASGNPQDSEETLNFAAQFGIKPMVETFPLKDAEKAYERMMSNKARFRVVITPN